MPPVAPEVLIRAVLIVPRIGFVVFLFVRPQVFGGKTVVCRHKVDGRRHFFAFVPQIVGRGHTLRHFGGESLVPAPETAGVVAETVVPLHPVFLEIADLITAAAAIPRLGDQFAFRQDGIGFQRLIERVILVKVAVGGIALASAPHDGRQIETETVNPHFLRPKTQRINRQTARHRLGHIQSVAATRFLTVFGFVIRVVNKVIRAVDALQAQHLRMRVALAHMVIDDVHNDFLARRVISVDHFFEFDGIAVIGVRREIGDRLVPPIVRQSFFGNGAVGRERLNGQKLNRRNPLFVNVFHDFGICQPREFSFVRGGNVGVFHRKALGVGFIDNGLIPRHVRLFDRSDGFQNSRILNDRLGRDFPRIRRVFRFFIIGIRCQIVVIPFKFPVQLTGVGVYQQLVRIKAHTAVGIVRSVHAVAIAHPRLCIGQIARPDAVFGSIRQFDSRFVFVFIEQAKLDLCRVFGKQCEINAFAVISRTQLFRTSGKNFVFCHKIILSEKLRELVALRKNLDIF